MDKVLVVSCGVKKAFFCFHSFLGYRAEQQYDRGLFIALKRYLLEVTQISSYAHKTGPCYLFFQNFQGLPRPFCTRVSLGTYTLHSAWKINIMEKQRQ